MDLDDDDGSGWVMLGLMIISFALCTAIVACLLVCDALGAEAAGPAIGQVVQLPTASDPCPLTPEPSSAAKPLCVLCGASWCPACQKMEHEVMPAVSPAAMGLVDFYEVDIDQRSDWRACLSSASVPELILIEHGRRHCLLGLQKSSDVEAFLEKWSN